jgi:hypothetical protein
MNREQAERIAQWWCDRMDDQRKNDNGEDAQEKYIESGGLGINNIAVKDQVRKDTFKRWLATMLLGTGQNLELIGVDYSPDDILQDALDLADIRGNPFPIKTWVRPQSMQGVIGYSGTWEDI